LRVRFVDTDASGRIHFSAMLRFFEAAEQEFLRSGGYGYQAMLDSPILFPRVHVACDYSGAVTVDDVLHIGVEVERIGGRSYTLGFEVLREGRAVARGKIVAAAMLRATGESTALPAGLAEALRRLSAVQPDTAAARAAEERR
jgi:acyl-CoA thioester hydrolase